MKTAIDPSAALVSELLMIRSDHTETPLIIRIGFPIQRGDSWACPCEIVGLDAQYVDVHGADSVQAMCLALRLIRSRLSSVMTKGNVLCLPGDRRPLTARVLNVWFGVN